MPMRKLDLINERIMEIPTLPVVAQRIMDLLNSEMADYGKVARLVEQDPALAVKILKVANSSFYATISGVSTIEHAMAILGGDEVCNILTSFSVYNFFRDKESANFDRRYFWQHAIVTSQVAKYLAAYNKLPDESIFLSGLIHDVGKIVLDYYFHDEFAEILAYVIKHQVPFSVAEKEIIGVTHYQVAAKLLQRWKFPDQVIRHVFYHHAPWHDQTYTEGSIVIYLANLLAKISGYSSLKEERPTDLSILTDAKLLRFLAANGFDLDEKKLNIIMANIRQFIEREKDNVLLLFAE